jgi:hypothetical protein
MLGKVEKEAFMASISAFEWNKGRKAWETCQDGQVPAAYPGFFQETFWY